MKVDEGSMKQKVNQANDQQRTINPTKRTIKKENEKNPNKKPYIKNYATAGQERSHAKTKANDIDIYIYIYMNVI